MPREICDSEDEDELGSPVKSLEASEPDPALQKRAYARDGANPTSRSTTVVQPPFIDRIKNEIVDLLAPPPKRQKVDATDYHEASMGTGSASRDTQTFQSTAKIGSIANIVGPETSLCGAQDWLQGSVRREFEQHNPFMFTEASSTVPNDTAQQRYMLEHLDDPELASTLDERLRSALHGYAPGQSESESSIPWSAYLNSPNPPASGDKTEVRPSHSSALPNRSMPHASAGLCRQPRSPSHTPISTTTPNDIDWDFHTPKPARISQGSTFAVRYSDSGAQKVDAPDSPDILAPLVFAGQTASANHITPTNEVALNHTSYLTSRPGGDSGLSLRRSSGPTQLLYAEGLSALDSVASPSTDVGNGDGVVGSVEASGKLSGKRSQKSKRTFKTGVDSIVQMGFTYAQADYALEQTSGNLEKAIEMLLEGQTMPDVSTTKQRSVSPNLEMADLPKSKPQKRKKGLKSSPVVEIITTALDTHGQSGGASEHTSNLQVVEGTVFDSSKDASDGNLSAGRQIGKGDAAIGMTKTSATTQQEKVQPEAEREARPKKRGRGRPRKSEIAKNPPDGSTELELAQSAGKSSINSDGPDIATAEARPVSEKSELVAGDDEGKENLVPRTQNQSSVPLEEHRMEAADELKRPKKADKAANTAEAGIASSRTSASSLSSSQVRYRVGLSRNARIAPLLRVMRK